MAIVAQIKYKSRALTVKLSATPITIGRSSEADVTVDDEMLSRNHCKIYIKSGLATVKDNYSKNGTERNGNLIHEHHIYIGDKIVVGNTLISIIPEEMTPREEKMHNRF